jgi:hypothetical protein
MDAASPRQGYSWEDWNRAVNRQLAQLQKDNKQLKNDVNLLLYLLLGDLDKKVEGQEPLQPRIIYLIENVCWDLMHEKKVMRDFGVWDDERRYGPGATVTFRGAAWVCQTENKGVKPGDGSCWRLAVKSDFSIVKQTVRQEIEAQLNGRKPVLP